MRQGFSIIILLLCATSCSKIVQINPPVSTITTSQVFADSTDASSAILGIYSEIINGSSGSCYFLNGALTFYGGASADELIPYYSSNDQFYPNAITADNPYIYSFLWQQAYLYIYQVNACIEGLQSSSGLSENVKRQFIGEAKFIRAFCYFYLFNLFGDVPYVSSATNWATNTLAKRASKDQIYGQILADLKESESNLRQDYSISGGERTRANSYSASAMLARVYLYQGKWDSASIEASRVINNTNQFGLETDLSRVFLANNNEAILQWQLNSGLSSTFNATPEAYNNLPSDQSTPPLYYLSPDLLKSFESGDLRQSVWVDSSVNSGVTYCYSYKYKIGPGQISPSSPATEYYMVLRLAEQYLIRAEGEAQQNKLDLAIADINMIRGRAHLLPLPSSLNQNQVLSAILQERRVELFSEWGHRWFDLKRWGIATQVLTANKGFTVDYHSLLYPIPQSELQTDPNLTQNPGY